MDDEQIDELIVALQGIRRQMERMADAAEAQVKETKAMRDLVEAKRDEEIREAWNS